MRRALSAARAALALERETHRRDPHADAGRRPEERAFLPAALEVLETPPSPTARVLTWAVVGFAFVALLWAWLGRVDEVAVAEGITIPSGRSRVVQAAEPGIVAAIYVRDGQAVREGDLLLELDTTVATAERERLRQELEAARLAGARFSALLATVAEDEVDPGGGSSSFRAPDGADPARAAAAHALFLAEREEQRARQAVLREEIARRRAERATVEAAIRRLDETIPLVQARAEARAELARGGHGSRLVYLEALQSLAEQRHERNIQALRLIETDAAADALRAQLRAQAAEFGRARGTELADAEVRSASLAQELAKAEQRKGLHRIAAPVGGLVQQLAVNTVGGVVQVAERLLVVAPAGETVELEAMVLNRDVGFIRPGQSAEVKLETFTFTRWGTVPGEVVSVSGDAVPDERRGPVYAARVRLLRDAVEVHGRPIGIGPGMAATVEIHTGRRRVLDYLLSPLARYRHEAMRER